MKLTENIITKLRHDHRARRKVAVAAGDVSDQTVIRWLKLNDANLTRFEVIQVICDYYKVDGNEVLESDKKAKP